MTSVNEKLWRKESTNYRVEILVGKTWVASTDTIKTLSAAEAAAAKALLDKSVNAARVCEHEIVHTNTVVWMEETAVVFRVAEKLRPTGEHVACRVCGESATIAFDGHDRWAVCTRCERTMPCPT